MVLCTTHTNCKCVCLRFLSLSNILFELCDSHLDRWGKEGILLFFGFPFANDFIIDRENASVSV